MNVPSPHRPGYRWAVPAIALLSGVHDSLVVPRVFNRDPGLFTTSQLLALLLVGCVSGIALINLQATVLARVGAMVGGQASKEQVRNLLAWSRLPGLLALALWIVVTLFVSHTPASESYSALMSWVSKVCWSIELLTRLAFLVIFVTLFRALQGVTVWNSLRATQLGLAISTGPVCILICTVLVGIREFNGVARPGTAAFGAFAWSMIIVYYSMLLWAAPSIFVFLFANRMPSEFVRFANRGLFLSGSAPFRPTWERPWSGILPFPMLALGLLVLPCIAGLLTPLIIQFPGQPRNFFHDYFEAWFELAWHLGHFLMLYAILLHYRVNASRRRKYECILMAFWIGQVAWFFRKSLIVNESLRQEFFRMEAEFPGSGRIGLAFTMWMAALFLLLIAMAFHRMFRPKPGADGFPLTPSRWIRVLYRFSAPAPWAIIVWDILYVADHPIYAWIGIFMFPMLMIRYFTYERMLLAPAIFLRSFRDDQAGAVLGSLLVREATRYAPVVALTHATQPPDRLATRARAREMPKLFTTDDATWQDWVRYQLGVCSFVLIDSTIGSDGVRWELEEIRRRLPNWRIVILARSGENFEGPDDVFILRYDLDRKALKVARRQLRAWLAHVSALPMEATDSRRREDLLPPENNMQRPAVATWLGTLGLIYGAGGILCNPLNALEKLFNSTQPKDDSAPYAWSPEYSVGFAAFSLLGFVTALMLTAASVGILRNQPWGRKLGWIYAWTALALALAFYGFSMIYEILPMARLADNFETIEQEDEFAGAFAAAIVVPLFRFAFPILAICLLAKLSRSMRRRSQI